MKVAVHGVSGRMGTTLLRLVHAADDLELAGALTRPGSPAVGRDAGELAGLGALGISVSDDVAAVLAGVDAVIDFSLPEPTLALLPRCVASGVPLVVGTTGFDSEGLAAIEAAATEVPVVFAPNMSVGVNVTLGLLSLTARALGEDWDVEVVEAHHRAKVDAPSGTALKMGEVVAEAWDKSLDAVAVYGRERRGGPRPSGVIGFSSIRAGDIVGEHTVLFAGRGERIEITHRAASRDNFAEGALRAVRFLPGRRPGLYDMQDVLGLSELLG
jgi:4-hydroxy-tetrahydrodipicolinate reductase